MKQHIALIPVLLLLGTYVSTAREVPVEKDYRYEVYLTREGRGRAQQGMVIKGKYLFSLEDGGHVNVYDFKKATPCPIADFTLKSACKDNHCNNGEFGIEKKKGASFPLLYISIGKPGAEIDWTCFVESITLKDNEFTSELVQKITLDKCNGWKEAGYTEIFGAPSWLIDRERRNLWVFSAIRRTTPQVTKRNEDNLYVATCFRIPALDEGENVVLGVKDIIRQVLLPYDIGFTQAGCMKDGKIYYAFGVGKNDPARPAAIRVYDTDHSRIASRFNLHEEILQEPEDIVIKGGWMYLNANTNAKTGEKPVVYRISLPKHLK